MLSSSPSSSSSSRNRNRSCILRYSWWNSFLNFIIYFPNEISPTSGSSFFMLNPNWSKIFTLRSEWRNIFSFDTWVKKWGGKAETFLTITVFHAKIFPFFFGSKEWKMKITFVGSYPWEKLPFLIRFSLGTQIFVKISDSIRHNFMNIVLEKDHRNLRCTLFNRMTRHIFKILGGQGEIINVDTTVHVSLSTEKLDNVVFEISILAQNKPIKFL